jgi:CRP/FNR family cyclic AMP-dependent transcriptional regulator
MIMSVAAWPSRHSNVTIFLKSFPEPMDIMRLVEKPVRSRPMNVINLFRNEKDAVKYSAGQQIFAAGEGGEKMYVVLDGEVDIVVAGQILETVCVGGLFGGMALTGAKARSATARARTECSLAAIDEKRFSFLVQNTPHFAIQVMKVTAERLRRQTQLLMDR